MIERLRTKAGSAAGESGFTLIELLVVMLILGILAAIAIPALLNQRDKATDASAKSMVRTMQTAMESCGLDNKGSYVPCNKTAIQAIEPTIAVGGKVSDLDVASSSATGYTIYATTTSTPATKFTLDKSGSTVTRTCDQPGKGGCTKSGSIGVW